MFWLAALNGGPRKGPVESRGLEPGPRPMAAALWVEKLTFLAAWVGGCGGTSRR
jgi:hypothetical protein